MKDFQIQLKAKANPHKLITSNLNKGLINAKILMILKKLQNYSKIITIRKTEDC